MPAKFELPQPHIVAHTQSPDRAKILASVTHVEIDSEPRPSVNWPYDGENRTVSWEKLAVDLGTRAVQKIPVVGDENMHAAFKSALVEVDASGRADGTLPVVESAHNLATMLHEIIREGGVAPSVVLALAAGGLRSGRLVAETTYHTLPLRGDLRFEEIAATFDDAPDFHSRVGVKGLRFQDKQRGLIDWSKVKKPELLEPVLLGVDPVSWLKMVDTFFPHTLVTKEEMWGVDRQQVINTISGEGFARIMDKLSIWRRERKYFCAKNEQEDLVLARTDVDAAKEEAGEWEAVFLEESVKNGHALAGPVIYRAETHRAIQKEVSDVLIFLINALEESGHGYTPILERLRSTSEPYTHRLDSVMRMIEPLSSERAMVQVAYLANRAFENVNSWQRGKDDLLLDYITVLFDGIVRYMEVLGWDPVSQIEQAIEQNTFNYPKELCTDEVGPCTSKAQVFSLCRLLRKAHIDGQQSLSRYHERFRGGVSLKKATTIEVGTDRAMEVRRWVRDELELIAIQHAGTIFAATAEELLTSLDFSKVILDVRWMGSRLTGHWQPGSGRVLRVAWRDR